MKTMTSVATLGGRIHYASSGKLAGQSVLFCTGRSMSMTTKTEDAPTCSACMKRAAKELRGMVPGVNGMK